MKKKILIIFGTRPEAIKMVSLIKVFKEENYFDVRVCNTAQHREMTDQVLYFFDVAVDYDLDMMQQDQSLNGLFSRLMDGIGTVLDQYRPDMVLVHGDTSTCLAGALASFHHNIPVGHVEAGLRTYDFTQPFPEEMNRQLCDKIASLHFAPTIKAVQQLKEETFSKDSIFLTGNTIVDTVKMALPLVNHQNKAIRKLQSWIDVHKKLILVTGHRRENFGAGMLQIAQALKTLAERDDVQLIYPVHLNPNVQDPIYQNLSSHANIKLCDPLDYESFLWLMSKSDLIITDSGGIQEEATVLHKKVFVTRNTTERQEAQEAGYVSLVGTNTQNIVDEVVTFLKSGAAIHTTSAVYGDGKATHKILAAVKNFFHGNEKH